MLGCQQCRSTKSYFPEIKNYLKLLLKNLAEVVWCWWRKYTPQATATIFRKNSYLSQLWYDVWECFEKTRQIYQPVVVSISTRPTLSDKIQNVTKHSCNDNNTNKNCNNNNNTTTIFTVLSTMAKPYARVHFGSSAWKSVSVGWPPSHRPNCKLHLWVQQYTAICRTFTPSPFVLLLNHEVDYPSDTQLPS